MEIQDSPERVTRRKGGVGGTGEAANGPDGALIPPSKHEY